MPLDPAAERYAELALRELSDRPEARAIFELGWNTLRALKEVPLETRYAIREVLDPDTGQTWRMTVVRAKLLPLAGDGLKESQDQGTRPDTPKKADPAPAGGSRRRKRAPATA